MEEWEKMIFSREMNEYFRAFMIVKYGGLKVKDYDPPYNVGHIMNSFRSFNGLKCKKPSKRDKNQGTGMQAVKGFNYFYTVIVVWDGKGFDEEALTLEGQPEESYDEFELLDESLFDCIESYYKMHPDPAVHLIARVDGGENEETHIEKEMKKMMMKKGKYVGNVRGFAEGYDSEEGADD